MRRARPPIRVYQPSESELRRELDEAHRLGHIERVRALTLKLLALKYPGSVR